MKIFRRPGIFFAVLIIAVSVFLYRSSAKTDNLPEWIEDIGTVKNIVVKDRYTRVETEKYFLYIRNSDREKIKNTSFSERGRKYNMSEKIRKYNMSGDNLMIGERIAFRGKVNRYEKKDDFDFEKYMKSRNILCSVNVSDLRVDGRSFLYSCAGYVKSVIRSRNRFLYKEKSDFLNSLVIGEREFLSDMFSERFKRTGTSHILAISGLHIDIIFSAVIFIIGGIRSRKKLAFVVALLIFYWLVSGFAFSSLRAVLILFVSHMAVLNKYRYDSLNALAVVLCIIMIGNMFSVFNLGLQLSFLSCASAAIFYRRLKKYLKSSMISISLACNILTFPVVISTFRGFPILFLVGNILTVPFIAFIVVLDFLSVALFGIFMNFSFLVASVNKKLIELMIWLNMVAGDFRFSYIEFRSQDLKFFYLYYIIVVCIVILYTRYRLRESFNGRQGFYDESQ